MKHNKIIIRQLGLQPYLPISEAMHEFTATRTQESDDEIWLVQHPQVFTQGKAGKAEHLLKKSAIPVIQTDRGGQITFHGPGQIVLYPLLDLRRRRISVRQLVELMEQAVINTLHTFAITSHLRQGAPGVYVDDRKICSLGLHISHGCSLHGLALNVNMDLTPFDDINPCGYAGLKMTQVSDFASLITLDDVQPILLEQFLLLLNSLNTPKETIGV